MPCQVSITPKRRSTSYRKTTCISNNNLFVEKFRREIDFREKSFMEPWLASEARTQWAKRRAIAIGKMCLPLFPPPFLPPKICTRGDWKYVQKIGKTHADHCLLPQEMWMGTTGRPLVSLRMLRPMTIWPLQVTARCKVMGVRWVFTPLIRLL